MKPKNILFLTTQLPYPPKSGGTIKSWRYLKNLGEQFSIGLACFLKDRDQEHLDTFKSQIQLQDFISTPLEVSRSPINLVLSYLLSPCLNVFRNRSKVFKKSVITSAKKYELIVIDHYEMFQYVPPSFEGKVILHTHNAEFMLWKRMGELTSNPLKKVLLYLESTRVKHYERKIFNQCDLIFSTPSDIQLYEEENFNTDKHRSTFHLGNDDLLNKPDLKWDNTNKSLVFMGTLSWEPNIDAMLWFIQFVWPSILLKHPNCQLFILGDQIDSRLRSFAQKIKNINFPGYVDDLEKYLTNARVFIVPLRFGSGMKVKVLDGLYRGIPMVSTSIGAEGIEVEDKKDILIADNPEDFSNRCIELLESKEVWENLSIRSRQLAKEKYRWEPLFDQMTTDLLQLYSNGGD